MPGAPPLEPAIDARDLHKVYRLGAASVEALAGADLQVERGERVAVVGRSGSGKSTLLNVVGGLDRPTGGRVLVEGRDLQAMDARELAAFRGETIGFVFQSFHLQPRFPAVENVALPLVFAGMGRRERHRRAAAMLERVGLAGRTGHRPSELSGGEQQRVALARSLLREPRLLLADEPTGNLDSSTSDDVMALLSEVSGAGTTVVVVTHDEPLARRFAERVIRMEDGRVVEDAGAPA